MLVTYFNQHRVESDNGIPTNIEEKMFVGMVFKIIFELKKIQL
jgi:hypothetical protein